MDDGERPALQQVRACLQLRAHQMQVWSFGVADGDHELRSREDVDLAELDGLRLIDIARGPKHEEQALAVALQLGTLVRLHGVLDGERVQIKLARDLVELLRVRAIQADPRNAVPVAACGAQFRQRLRCVRALAVAVDRAIDDHTGGFSAVICMVRAI